MKIAENTGIPTSDALPNGISVKTPLSPEQRELAEKILQFCRRENHTKGMADILVINGAAGTGKSLLLLQVFSAIQRAKRSPGLTAAAKTESGDNYLLVNHPEMLKLYQNRALEDPFLKKKDFERPTTFINQAHKTTRLADIVLVDEAHLLLSRPDAYNHFYQDNQLAEILQLCRKVILVFDACQVLKFKSLWDTGRLHELLKTHYTETYHLTTQFRIQAAPAMEQWIQAFVQQRLLAIPKDNTGFDFRVFDDLSELYACLLQKDREWGMCRLLSTYDYPYKLDGKDYFITEGGFRMRWDRANPTAKLPWAERPESMEEVGSVYTIQGFDLNYAGVILGPSIDWDAVHEKLELYPERYEDQAAFRGKPQGLPLRETQEKLMLNALNVLLGRGRKGLFLFAHNPSLRKKLLTLYAGK